MAYSISSLVEHNSITLYGITCCEYMYINTLIVLYSIRQYCRTLWDSAEKDTTTARPAWTTATTTEISKAAARTQGPNKLDKSPENTAG